MNVIVRQLGGGGGPEANYPGKIWVLVNTGRWI